MLSAFYPRTHGRIGLRLTTVEAALLAAGTLILTLLAVLLVVLVAAMIGAS